MTQSLLNENILCCIRGDRLLFRLQRNPLIATQLWPAEQPDHVTRLDAEPRDSGLAAALLAGKVPCGYLAYRSMGD
jgi:hypothetical protein